MTEKELIKNLSALKKTEADSSWIKSNRDVLSYQIFNGAEYVAMPLGLMEKFSLITKRLLQPAPIAALIALFFVTSGAVSVRIARNTTPGDPLYLAKSISERTQLLATFNETDKAKLNLEFANQRVNEIKQVMANEEVDAERVEELSASFKKEIASARERLTKIEAINKVSKPKVVNENDAVVSAEAGKDNNGIDISVPDNQKTLQEAEKLFDSKDYGAVAEKLGELGEQLK